MNKLLKYELYTTCSILGTTFLLGSGLVLSNFVSADTTDAVDTLTITVNNSCSIARADGNTGSYSSTIANGNTGTITGTTFKTTCNDSGGYSIYAIGYSNDTDGNTILDSGSLGDNYDIATGTATSGSTSNWAMKLEAGADGSTIQNSYSGFKAVPSTYTKVTTKTSGTTPTSTNTATVTYQVYIANEQPAGTYTGKVKYTLVHPSTACPDGYTLEGGVCTAPSLTSITTMQAMTPAICNATSVGTSKQLKDTRDNKYYWVTKLADNNCWMTQNLDFNIDSTKTYTPADTNISSNWQPSVSTYATGTTTWNDTWDEGDPYTDPESYDPGDLCWNGNVNTGYSGTLATATVACTSSNKNYHIGNYYSWTAAVAMDDSSSYMTKGVTITQSICPKGWTLPLGNTTSRGSFYYLLNQYGLTSSITSGSNSILGAPLSFVLGGSWDGESFAVGSKGYYWSSMVGKSDEDSDRAYILNIGFGSVSPWYDATRDSGHNVRCVAVQ